MSWRQAYDVREYHHLDKLFDFLESSVPGQIRLVATPERWVDRSQQWHGGQLALVISSECVAIAAGKMFGGARLAFQAPILDFLRGGFGPLSGSGPLWEVYEKLGQDGSVSFLFNRPNDAEAVVEYINSGVALARRV